MRKIKQLGMCLSFSAATILTVAVLAIVSPVVADDAWDGGVVRSASAIALEERIAAGDLKYRDSRTGEVVVATHARVAVLRMELAPQFGWPAAANVTTAADGTVRAESNGAVRDVFVVRTNLDGTRTRGCFRDLDAAVAFVVGLNEDQEQHSDGQTRVVAAE